MPLNGFGPLTKANNRVLAVSRRTVDEIQPKLEKTIDEFNEMIDIAKNQSANESEFSSNLYTYLKYKEPLKKPGQQDS